MPEKIEQLRATEVSVQCHPDFRWLKRGKDPAVLQQRCTHVTVSIGPKGREMQQIDEWRDLPVVIE